MQNTVTLQELCTGLEQFGLPCAIANLNEQRFVAWNSIFLEQTGFSGTEIGILNLGSTVVLTDSTMLEPGGTEKYLPGLIPCVVRAALGLSVLPGYIRRSPEGLAHIILGPTQSISEHDFQYWELVGREKERIRIRQIFHDDVFSPILTAVFAIAAAKEATNAAEQTEFLRRASDVLTSTFELVGTALEGKESADRGTDTFSQSSDRLSARGKQTVS